MEHKKNEPTGDSSELKALIEAALDAGRDPRPGRAQRADGWTPERIRTFLEALARGASVSAAASGAGISARSAYLLYRRADAFRVAWDAALRSVRRPPAGPVRSRAMHGYVEPIVRNGKVWGEIHRHDNRLLMSVLTALDRRRAARTEHRAEIRIVAESFDEYVEIVGSGDARAAADFLEARRGKGHPWQL